MAQRDKQSVNPNSNQMSISEMMSRLMSNTSDSKVYFHAIPAEVYYNDSTEWTDHDFRRMFNLTGLSTEDIPVVMAFPRFTSDNSSETTTIESLPANNGNDSMANNTDNAFSARGLPVVRETNTFSLFNPRNWFRFVPSISTPTTTTTTTPTPTMTYPTVPAPQVSYYGQPIPYNSYPAHLQDAKIDIRPLQKMDIPLPQSPLKEPMPSKDTSYGNGLISSIGKVETPILRAPELQNVELNGPNPQYSSYPMVSSGVRIASEPNPKPEYPLSDNIPQVMDVVYS